MRNSYSSSGASCGPGKLLAIKKPIKKPLKRAASVLRGTASGKTRIDGKIDNLIKFNVQFEFDITKLLF